MSFSSHNLVLKTRKRHKCAWCGEHIPAGTTAAYFAGIFDCDFSSGHLHPECWRVEHFDDSRDPWEFYGAGRGRIDDQGGEPKQVIDTPLTKDEYQNPAKYKPAWRTQEEM